MLRAIREVAQGLVLAATTEQLNRLRRQDDFARIRALQVPPLKLEEAKDLIRHRLEEGKRPAPTFSDEALEIIWQFSEGNPPRLLQAANAVFTAMQSRGHVSCDAEFAGRLLGVEREAGGKD